MRKNIKWRVKMERKTYIDIAKGIAVILVIMGHCEYTDFRLLVWLYTFHMPLFFIINGLFISIDKYPTLKEFVKKKAKTLLVPYFILSIPVYICSIGLETLKMKTINIEIMLKKFVGIFIAWRKTPFDNGMWFILALFLANILVYIILKAINNYKIKNSKRNIALIIISISIFAVGLIITKFIKGFIWSIDVVPVCASFVMIGYLLNKLDNKKDIFSNMIIGICMFAINIIFGYLNYKVCGKPDIHGSNLGNGLYYLLSAVSGSVFIICLSKKINTNKILESIAKHSFIYYALQGTIAIPIAKNGVELIFKLLNIQNMKIIIWILTIIISILILEILSRLLEKFLPKVFKRA